MGIKLCSKLAEVRHFGTSKLLTKPLLKNFADYFYMRKLPKQGCLPTRFRSKDSSRKRPHFIRRVKFKLSNHNGLLKRIRIVK